MTSLNPNCKECGLWKTTKGTVCVAGDGPKDADIIIIGEAPGAAEERTGKPFQGESGRILRDELRKNDLDSVYITNVVKCRPPDNRTPTPAEVKACKKYLDQELAEIDPEYVVTVGGTATKALFRGKAKITQVHGELITSDKVKYIGMPTFHPAYTLRDPSKLPGFQNDIRRLAEHYYGEAESEEVVWNVVRRGNLQDFIDQFIEAREFAFDCETAGLFQYGGLRYIVAVGIALPSCTWIIPGHMHPDFWDRSSSPWRHGRALHLLLRLLFDLAKQTNKSAYAWNGKFDNIWLNQMFGGSFRLEMDGMLAAHTLNENTSNDLTTNCRTFLGVEEYDIPLHLKQGKLKRGEKASTNWKYCAEDATYTLRLVQLFKKELRKDEQVERLFWNLVMPAARAMERIEQRGLTVDKEQMIIVGDHLRQQKMLLEKKLNRLVGRSKGEVNWNSPQQIGPILFGELGIKPRVKTPKGKPSTSEQALLDLMGEHEVVDTLLKYREVTKFLSTYIDGLGEFMVGDKLYVSYKLHGTVTGRYSSRIHSIPRDGKIRNLITAPPGWRFVQGDISQAELRVAASASQDPELIRCFTEGTDVHWRTLMETLRVGQVGDYAKLVWSTATEHLGWKPETYDQAIDVMLSMGHDIAIALESEWKEGRKRAKAINFGFIYGMYEKKFIETAKQKYQWEPSQAEAKLARDTYFQLYWGIPQWHEKQKKLARLNGSVRSLSGRLRRLPAINSRDRMAKMEAERQAINSPIQGFIGDYKAMVIVEVEETIDPEQFRLVGEHHDAILGEVRIGCEDEVLPKVAAIMRGPRLLKVLKVNLSVPLTGELELGNWGLGKEYKL